MENRKGFTLTEILFVVAVMLPVSAVVLPVYANAPKSRSIRDARLTSANAAIYAEGNDLLTIACSTLTYHNTAIYFGWKTDTTGTCTGSTPYRKFARAYDLYLDGDETTYYGDQPRDSWTTFGPGPNCNSTASNPGLQTPSCQEYF